jgi:hypothetical protein
LNASNWKRVIVVQHHGKVVSYDVATLPLDPQKETLRFLLKTLARCRRLLLKLIHQFVDLDLAPAIVLKEIDFFHFHGTGRPPATTEVLGLSQVLGAHLA